MRLSRIFNDFEKIDLSSLKMPLIVVYNKPLDFPDKYVARIWDLNKPTDIVVVKDTLEDLRNIIPTYMNCIPRNEKDDYTIVEVWI